MVKIAPTYTPRPVDPAHLEGDLVRPGSPLHGLVWINPQRLGGTPCFYGTRVPVHALFDHIEGGETIDEFLEGFPPLTREHVLAVLELAQTKLLGRNRA